LVKGGQQIFETQFGSNSDKFMQFIVSFLYSTYGVISRYKKQTRFKILKTNDEIIKLATLMEKFYENIKKRYHI